MDPVLVVPVKAFAEAKARLAPVLSIGERARLARWTAERVLRAAEEMPVFVVCDDEVVAGWAREHGADVLWHPGVGLNAAVNAAIADLRGRGVRHVVVAHGDLPRAEHLRAVVNPGVVTLVPDRHVDGTNVVSMPTEPPGGAPFELSYGPASFRRHLTALRASGLAFEVRRDALLGVDIDTPADLLHPLVLEVLPPWLPTNQANPRSTAPA